MTTGKDHHSEPGNMSYRDALQHHMQSRPSESGSVLGNSATTQKDLLSRLKASLCSIMLRHPEGVALAEVRRSCPLLCDPGLLEGFASAKELLASLTDVVWLQGIGVQTRVHPAKALCPH